MKVTVFGKLNVKDRGKVTVFSKLDVKDRRDEAELVLDELVLREIGSAPLLPQSTAKPPSTQWLYDHLTRFPSGVVKQARNALLPRQRTDLESMRFLGGTA